jgi:hypothetical protein
MSYAIDMDHLNRRRRTFLLRPDNERQYYGTARRIFLAVHGIDKYLPPKMKARVQTKGDVIMVVKALEVSPAPASLECDLISSYQYFLHNKYFSTSHIAQCQVI